MRIAIGHHEIGRVLSGQQRFFLRRDRGVFCRVRPGDALWLAEPFHLETRFDHRTPTAARDCGGQPLFSADHPDGPPPGYGKRHPARPLCRDWHRFHIVIETREALRLQRLPGSEIAAMGFASVEDFALHWDRESSLIGGRGFQWRDDPEVLHFGFSLLREPLTALAAEAHEARERRGAWREPARQPVEPARTGECPRCGARLAAGCVHNPLARVVAA
jgi:hypothetical protein